MVAEKGKIKQTHALIVLHDTLGLYWSTDFVIYMLKGTFRTDNSHNSQSGCEYEQSDKALNIKTLWKDIIRLRSIFRNI